MKIYWKITVIYWLLLFLLWVGIIAFFSYPYPFTYGLGVLFFTGCAISVNGAIIELIIHKPR